ncbi:MAG: hypothetical protein AAF318_10940 [Pseudomonadota bacterium]
MFGENVLVAVVLVVASLLGSALLVLALQWGTRRRAALKNLAAANGWHYEYQGANGGRGSTVKLFDPKARWTVTIYSNTANDHGGSTTRWTRFERQDLAIDKGAAILGPSLPPQAIKFAAMVMENLVGRFLGKLLMGIDEAGADLSRLAHVDHVDPTSGTLFATPEAENALDPILGHGALVAAREGKDEMKQPIVSRTAGGFRIRVRRALYDPAALAALVTLGEVLAAAIADGADGPDEVDEADGAYDNDA